LQQKASTAGKESTDQVASGLQIIQVTGKHDNTHITRLAIYVTPNAGSAPIDLKQCVLSISDGTTKTVTKSNATVSYQDLSTGGNIYNASGSIWANLTDTTKFGVVEIQDADGSCSKTTPVLNKGDIVAIVIDELTLDTRTDIAGSIQPEFGAPGVISFTTPATYISTQSVVQLQ